MSKRRVFVAGSAIRISIAMAGGDPTWMQEQRFLVNNQEHMRKSRGRRIRHNGAKYGGQE